MKDNCWDHMETSILNPIQLTRMSNVLVMGSTLPTRSKTIFTVEMKIFQMQYMEKKYPSKLKYIPWHVLDHSILSWAFCNSWASRNRNLDNSSRACTSVLSKGTLSGTDGATDLIFPHQVPPPSSPRPLARSLLSLSASAIFFFFMAIISMVCNNFLSIFLTSSRETLLINTFMLV